MSDPRGFRVPKILRRQESKDNLRTVDLKSRDAQEISDIVSRSYLERNYKSPWEVKTLHLIENKELLDSYRIKKAEMKEEGRHARDLADQYAFLLFRDSSVMAKVIKQGLVARQMPFNALGASKFGVYLCRNADVQLRLADGKGLSNCTLVVFKIMLGKCKTLTGQSGAEGENIEPTPNYDCHVSQVQARPSDSLYLQLARSQVFLYEYTDECVPSERPRQCLPYAIMSYEKLEKKETAETSSAYGKQTAATSLPSATATASEIMASLKKSISFIDNLQNPETPSLGLRSSSDPNFQSQSQQQMEVPLQANIVHTEPKPRDPRMARMGEPKAKPVDPRLNKPGLRDPRMRPTDPRTRQNDLKNDQKTSIPLPNFSDPRFQPLDQGATDVTQNPSDPRSALQDPRLNPADPRNSSLFTQSSRPSDPRLRANPALKSLAKNLQSAMSIFGDFGEEDPDNSAYQPSFGPPVGGVPQQAGFSNTQAKPESLSSLPDIAIPRDPRIRRDPRLMHEYLTQQAEARGLKMKPTSDTIADQGGGKVQRKKLSIHDYKRKTDKQDDSSGPRPMPPLPGTNILPGQSIAPAYYGSFQAQGYSSAGSGMSDVYDHGDTEIDDGDMPYSPDYDEIPDPTIPQAKPEETVATPQMMMQTLSELSEPDDVSQSPKPAVEAEASGVESALTVAIRKLVEHSPDMSILTQAIQVLGQTHDMADILEALKKAMESQMKPGSVEKAEKLRTPEEVLSTELIKNDDSPLSEAMMRTLAEVDKQEKEAKISSEAHGIKPDSDLANILLPEKKPQLADIPVHDNKPEVDSPLPKSQIDGPPKDPKIQEFVKFFLDKEEENDGPPKSNMPSLGVKESPGIGFSPAKSLLLGGVDRDERQHAIKQMFQGESQAGPIALDRDERLQQQRNSSLSPILSPDPNEVFVDERHHPATNEIGDIDLRRSHSRSLSPVRTTVTQSSAMRDIDERSLSPLNPFSSKSVIPGLGDVDERSLSPVASRVIAGIKAEVRSFPSPIMSPDSESRDSSRNDMMNKNNSNVVEKDIPLDVDFRQVKNQNEFGDVDWRLTAAAEMGDVDLRVKPNQASVLPPVFDAIVESKKDSNDGNDFWSKRESKDGDMEFRQGFGVSKTDYQKEQQEKLYDAYATSSKRIDSYESSNMKIPSYSTTGNVYGEYSSSNKAEIGNMNAPPQPNLPPFQPGPGPGFFPPQNQNFNQPPGPPQPMPPQQPNFSNILGSVNLDMANLKNILASVQKPPEMVIPKNNFVEEVVEEEEEVTSNLPAFVTGLCKESPKKDLTLTKYTGKPREWVPGKKLFVPKEEKKPEMKDPNYDPTRAPELQRPILDPRFEKQWHENKGKPPGAIDRNFGPPMPDIKFDRKDEPSKSDQWPENKGKPPGVLDRNFGPPKPDIKFDRKDEPSKSVQGGPAKLDRNFKPIKDEPSKSDQGGPVKLDRNFKPIKADKKDEPVKLDRNFRPIKPDSKTPDETPQNGQKGSEIRKLVREDIGIGRKTEKSLSKKDDSDDQPSFSLGDLLRQVRGTSADKDKKKDSGIKEIDAKKDGPEKVSKKTNDKDNKESKSKKEVADKGHETKGKSSKTEKESDSSDSDDQGGKIFSLGDILKRMRGIGHKKSDKDKKVDNKQKKKSSPKKRRSNENEQSYQEAFMESLETSDLKVKHDDSIISEADRESPKGRKHNDSISKDMYSDINQSTHDRSIDTSRNTSALDKSRQAGFKDMGLDNVSDNSDDESFGLVIDLGETPAKKSGDRVQRKESDKKKDTSTEEGEIEDQEEDDCLVVEMVSKKEVVDLTEDDHDHDTVPTDGTSVSRKSRRQRRSAEDTEHLPLIKKIKTEKTEDDEQREKQLAEEAKLADAVGVETDDTDMAVVAGVGQGEKVAGPQPRKKIVINLKSSGKKSDKKEAEKKDGAEKCDDKAASEAKRSDTDKSAKDSKKTDLGPIRQVERLGQRNLAEPRGPSPITVLGAPPRAPSPAQKFTSTSASLHSPSNTAPSSSQSWSSDQQTLQSLKQEQFEGQAIPNLSQISSIPLPHYRAASPVNQIVPGVSSVGPPGFSTMPPASVVPAGARPVQSILNVMPPNVSAITVPMPPVGSLTGPPAFRPMVAPPNLSVPPPNIPLLNVPPPSVAGQPPTHTLMPGMVIPNLQNPPPSFRPTMQGNLTIPIIGQAPAPSTKEAMMQDVLQRVRQIAPAAMMSQSMAQPVQGMPIQTIGQPSTSVRPSHPNTNLMQVETNAPEVKKERSKDDVLDWFSDKFELKKEPRDHSTPIRAHEESGSRSYDSKEHHDSDRKRVWEYHENDDYGKKARLKPSGDNHGDYYYESRSASEHRTGTLEQHPLENRGSSIQSLTPNVPTESSNVGESMEAEEENSDLEEGECSEDSSVPGSPLITDYDNRRVVMQSKVGNNIEVQFAANSIQRIQTIGDTSSPKRIVKVSDHSRASVPAQRHRNVAADDWSDMLSSDSNEPRENEKRTSAFTRLDSSDSRTVARKTDSQDSVLASSLAVITKTKNKMTKAFQVKTLGDWLKVELDIENIQPLQKYIPYAFNTDLTTIPKGRRRKIKTKVRTELEKQGKASGIQDELSKTTASPEDDNKETDQTGPAQVEIKELETEVKEPETKPEPPKPVHRGPPINPSYSPEVPNAQIQTELELVKKAKQGIKDKNSSAVSKGSKYGSLSGIMAKEMSPVHIIPGSEAEAQLIAALVTLEAEMVAMLQRTYFYGYPHRRVPKDLLLESELYSFKSPEEGVFLILMMPLSIKPYNKLKVMKKEIEALLKRSETDPSPEIDEELKAIHVQREQVLRSFTGYLNKKRVAKLQDLVNKYTTVYDYFKGQPRCPSDSALKFIRTTQIDLRQHLILAKQYLAMDEKNKEAEAASKS